MDLSSLWFDHGRPSPGHGSCEFTLRRLPGRGAETVASSKMAAQTNSSSRPECSYVTTNALLFFWLMLYVLLLPLFLCVLYVGYGQRRRRRAPAHSDVFTFHIVAMEMLTMVGSAVYSFSRNDIGDHLFSVGEVGQMFIHTLTCADRYLAVARPVTYLRLKERGGVMVRNLSLAGVWLFTFALPIVLSVIEDYELEVYPELDGVLHITLVLLLFTVVTFCSLAVLRVLIRPAPGEGGGATRRVDRTKRRAFLTIVTILGVLLLRLLLFLVDYVLYILDVLDEYDSCLIEMAGSLLNFPSALVLPLMFLHKSGKLPKCRRNKGNKGTSRG